MHSIHYWDEDENVNKKSIMAEICEYARENGDGYSSDFIWHENVAPLATRAEALAFIRQKDNGWYSDHAVRYYDYSGAKETVKIKELKQKSEELLKAMQDFMKNHSVKNFKAEYIGCSRCGSKINRRYLRGENCPVCNQDLRSKTTFDKVQWYNDKIKKVNDSIEAEKMKQKGKVMWLIKFEFHC